MCSDITHIVAKPGFFAGVPDKNIDEVDDYLSTYPDKKQSVIDTLSYFNLEHFCKDLKADTLLWGTTTNLSRIRSQIPVIQIFVKGEKSLF